MTYQDRGLLAGSGQLGWYDPGWFWGGDRRGLSAGFRPGGEIAAHVPPGEPGIPQAPAARS